MKFCCSHCLSSSLKLSPNKNKRGKFRLVEKLQKCNPFSRDCTNFAQEVRVKCDCYCYTSNYNISHRHRHSSDSAKFVFTTSSCTTISTVDSSASHSPYMVIKTSSLMSSLKRGKLILQ